MHPPPDPEMRRAATRQSGSPVSQSNFCTAEASKSLEEAARIMKRTPERIRQVAMRLGVSFKATKTKK